MMSENARAGFGITRILEMIPHRYPFVLIDRIVSIIPGRSAVALKNVTMNENFFVGHFPSKPVMPGVLIVEAMAQTAAVFLIDNEGVDIGGKLIYFTSIESAKFRKAVEPGDSILIEVTKLQSRGNLWKVKADAKVDGKMVAEAVIGAALVDA